MNNLSLKFWKMNGLGNDFIIINNIDYKFSNEELSELAVKLCDRRMSIGADGFIAIDKSTKADARMLFYNSDGSMGEMCGNGARCISRYLNENSFSGDKQYIETTAGIVVGEKIDNENYKIRLNDPVNFKFDIKLNILGKDYNMDYVELGNPGIPHVAVYIKNLKEVDRSELFEIGRLIRYDAVFEKGTNVNFYDFISQNELYEITYERGVEDFTYACGTGTGSVVSILTKRKQVSGKDVRVHMKGGILKVDIDVQGDDIKNLFITGPTSLVCKGEAQTSLK